MSRFTSVKRMTKLRHPNTQGPFSSHDRYFMADLCRRDPDTDLPHWPIRHRWPYKACRETGNSMGALANHAPPTWMEDFANADMSWIYDATGLV